MGVVRYRDYLRGFLAVAVFTIVAFPLRTHLSAANLVMLYLVGVVVVAAKASKRVAVLTSILSVAAFDFFCVPPYLTFRVSDYEYLITFAVMLGLAVFISAMTARLRAHALAAIARESQTAALYRLSNNLVGRTRMFDILKAAAELAEETFNSKVSVFMPDEAGQVSFTKRPSERLFVPTAEQEIAQWVFQHNEEAGKGTHTHRNASALYVPVK